MSNCSSAAIVAKLGDLAGRERRLLQQKRGDVLLADDGELIGRGPAAGLARLLRERDEPQAVEHPAGDGQDAAVGQMIEVIVERLDGVERVLGQRVGARRRGGPRIDERRLNDVVRSGALRTKLRPSSTVMPTRGCV